MFAACAKTETEDVIPVNPEPEDEAQTVYVEIGATTGSDTKATYDKDLNAYWEAGDQILAVQGHACDWKAGGNEKTIQANTLNLNSGELTNSAIFAGDISTQTNSTKFFHFAYPATNTELYTYGNINLLGTSNTQTSTCTYTIPSEQDGKWTPFLCTSTADKTTAANITSISFGESRNACFAVRVYGSDKTTPKKIKSIAITAENNIIGTLSATTENDGSFNGDKVVFGISGGGNTITADNLQNIEPLNGLYEYRFEVLPNEPNTNSGKITLTITDESGSVITRQASAKAFNANICSGVKVYWDDATITMDKPLSWYEDTTAGKISDLKPGKIYVNNVTINGDASNITEVGVYVNGIKYPENNVSLSFNKEIAATEGNGVYKVKAYAVSNNKEIYNDEQNVIVTGDLNDYCKIRSSYTENNNLNKTNAIDGDKIYVYTNDNYIASLFTSGKLSYDDNVIDINTITGNGTSTPTLSLGEHKCHAEITFSNGYTLKTNSGNDYTIYVTGIPYSINFTNGSPAGWTTNNTAKSSLGDYLRLVHGTAWIISPRFIVPETCDIVTTINAGAYRSVGTYNPNIYISISNTGKSGGTPTQLNGKNATSMSYQDISRDLQIGIEDNNSHICIYSSGNKPGAATNNAGITVKTCNVKYK